MKYITTPHMKNILDSLTPESPLETIVVIKPQSYTFEDRHMMMEVVAKSFIENKPVMFVSSTKEQAEQFTKENIEPMFKDEKDPK